MDRFLNTVPEGRVAEIEEIMAACNLSKAVAFAIRQAWMSLLRKAEEQQ